MLRNCIIIMIIFITLPCAAATVTVEKNSQGWTLMVDGEPFFVQGVCYDPCKVGESPDENTSRDWMIIDDDEDGQIDAAYQSWVDLNRNNWKDKDEVAVGDFQLLKEMGTNVIRLYHHASDDPDIVSIHPHNLRYNHAPNKELLRDLYKTYGIRVMMGDLLGAYTMGSGASWSKGTDYTDPQQLENMLKSVERMVQDFKDEPYILFWALGNENNYIEGTKTNANVYPVVYAKFVNKVVSRIHELDPDHPVVLVNGGLNMMDTLAEHAPAIDIIGINSYRPESGFGGLWTEVARLFDRPVLITEFGTPQPVIVDGQLDEIVQYQKHVSSWRDIVGHAAGKDYPGNAIGGFVSTWMDCWWKSWNPSHHNLSSNGWHSEWIGIAAQGDGRYSLFMRQLRHVYYAYQEMWTQKE